jgi:adenosylmethionine-8-amino-7-oxononanoate aminotransferase
MFDAHYSNDRSKLFFHSSSYTANPIACAAAASNLAIWREEPVLERIASLTRRQSDQLSRLRNVRNARQIGTITAVDIGGGQDGYLSSEAPRLLRFFHDRDLLLRPLGNTVYVMPPYCINDEDLGKVYDAIQEASGPAPAG